MRIAIIVLTLILSVSIVYAEQDNKDASAPNITPDSPVTVGMSKEDLLKVYHRGDVKKFEKNGAQEVLVFDDTKTSIPEDTITFYLVDGKVRSWDKNRVIFPTDEGLRSAIRANISKEDLLRIYNIGNLKAYSKDGNQETATFYDILTSDPDDTVTFYLTDGKVRSWTRSKIALPSRDELHKIFPVEKRKVYAKSGNTEAETYENIFSSDPNDTITFYIFDGMVSSWDINTEASIANAKLIDETMSDARQKAQSDSERAKAEADMAKSKARKDKAEADARSKAKLEADFKEAVSRARADVDARMKAMEERSRYDNYSASQSTQTDDIVKAKQQSRASAKRGTNWNYNRGLYYW